jgi:hypothetical protein
VVLDGAELVALLVVMGGDDGCAQLNYIADPFDTSPKVTLGNSEIFRTGGRETPGGSAEFFFEAFSKHHPSVFPRDRQIYVKPAIDTPRIFNK